MPHRVWVAGSTDKEVGSVYGTVSTSLERITEEMVALSQCDKARFVARLREALPLEPENWARLKLAQDAFDFWDN